MTFPFNKGSLLNFLQNCDQTSLAYLTAVTHGLLKEADGIKEGLEEEIRLPEVMPGAIITS